MISAIKIIFLLTLFIVSNLFSQDFLRFQFDKAVKLFDQERYFDTITELKRLMFFDNEKVYSFQSNFLIGKSYKAGAKFDEAINYFTLAEISARDEMDYFTTKIFKARTNILRRTTKQAERILIELEKNKRFDSLQSKINYWKGWCYIFSDQWEKAYNIFSKNKLDTTLANVCKLVDDDFYNEDFAKFSSYIIPGLGQFYTGEYLSGALSLGWNILFGYLTINAFVEDRIFDGIVIGNFLWLRFYLGNIQNSKKFAEQKNLEISNKALRFLQVEFKGEKP